MRPRRNRKPGNSIRNESGQPSGSEICKPAVCLSVFRVDSVRSPTAPTAIKEFSRVYASVDTPVRL